MEYLDFLDLLGPFITTIVAIIALYGNLFNEKEKGWKRLNRLGRYLVGFFIFSAIISILSTRNNNIENKELLKNEIGRYDTLNVKYQAIRNELQFYRYQSDSLNETIKKLKNQLIDISVKELEEQRRILKENQIVILDNLVHECVYNYATLHDSSRIVGFINSEFFLTGRFKNDDFKRAKELPIGARLRVSINKIIGGVNNLNEMLESILYSRTPEERRVLIHSLIRQEREIEKSLKSFFDIYNNDKFVQKLGENNVKLI